ITDIEGVTEENKFVLSRKNYFGNKYPINFILEYVAKQACIVFNKSGGVFVEFSTEPIQLSTNIMTEIASDVDIVDFENRINYESGKEIICIRNNQINGYTFKNNISTGICGLSTTVDRNKSTNFIMRSIPQAQISRFFTLTDHIDHIRVTLTNLNNLPHQDVDPKGTSILTFRIQHG
ncbi:hypothetical protein, partial [Staphylococcus aureus]|uniref:hypothetical protein n=1 Tax=Staphylococcus aureus TaxID=1280 RepID=UPI001C1FF0EB